jgi:hypothetical protein
MYMRINKNILRKKYYVRRSLLLLSIIKLYLWVYLMLTILKRAMTSLCAYNWLKTRKNIELTRVFQKGRTNRTSAHVINKTEDSWQAFCKVENQGSQRNVSVQVQCPYNQGSWWCNCQSEVVGWDPSQRVKIVDASVWDPSAESLDIFAWGQEKVVPAPGQRKWTCLS